MEENIIARLNLTEQEVLSIVSEWYQSGAYQDILQDEEGSELCEIVQGIYDNLKEEQGEGGSVGSFSFKTNKKHKPKDKYVKCREFYTYDDHEGTKFCVVCGQADHLHKK